MQTDQRWLSYGLKSSIIMSLVLEIMFSTNESISFFKARPALNFHQAEKKDMVPLGRL